MSVYSVNGIEDLNFDGFMIGFVRDNVDETMEGRIKVYIPKIFYNDINSGIWVRPMNYLSSAGGSVSNGGSFRVPAIDSKVLIIFLDSDPQKGYYFPFSPSLKGEKISRINSSANFLRKDTMANVDVIRSYANGNRIEMDNNDNNNACFRLKYYDANVIINRDGEFTLGLKNMYMNNNEYLLELLSKTPIVRIGKDVEGFSGLNISSDTMSLEFKDNKIFMNEGILRITKSNTNTNFRFDENGATLVVDGGTRIDVGNNGKVLIKSDSGASITLENGNIVLTSQSGDSLTLGSGISLKTSGIGKISFSGTMPELSNLQSQINDLQNQINSMKG